MGSRRIRALLGLAVTVVLLVTTATPVVAAPKEERGSSQVQQRYQEKARKTQERIERMVTAEERAGASKRLNEKVAALGLSEDAGTAEYFAAMDMPMPGPGDVPDYSGMTPNWAYSPQMRKFVDGLPGLGEGNANNLGQYLSVAKPDTVMYPGSDYYEIELREYTEQLHSDMPPTTLRGYVQVNNGTDSAGNNTLAPDPIHYLGPTIMATKDRPVRVKFTNKLPTGDAGDLFIPVDTTVMGAGMGPLMHDVPAGTPMNYTENRATLHLHGGRSPWISDGTAHQWITPAGENTPYPEGVSVQNVPDMPDPGDGSMTFYYTNAQSARLMFYHDHSFGITRLNVYAGEAAGYLISDAAEDKLVADGTIPAEQIPLIIQDKTFVDAATITMTDPTWRWGTGEVGMDGYRVPKTGDLWIPHVYMPAQNPYDISGYNAMGRWHYGPWFWPPTEVTYGPVPNPYYISETETPGQPPMIPGVPHPSMGMEAFFDTPLINGTAYPVLEVDPSSYRFRVLNASNDRFWNLQLYEADPDAVFVDPLTGESRLTEVKMVPAVPRTDYPDWPLDGREGGVPDPTLVGPDMIQIATEGGFLPTPVVLESQPIDWNVDVTTFNAGNVESGTLMLGPAERADVVVDFSAYAGKTLILYNDAPAPWPAGDPRYDYYTGNPDLTEQGGAPSTQAGYGPNTRTIMQIKIADAAPAEPFDLDALNAAFTTSGGVDGVFKSSQDDIIVSQAAYNSAYGATFSATWPDWGLVRIFDNALNFKTVTGESVSLALEPKAIQDEMGETFDREYGRMAGRLGLELPNTIAGRQNFMLYDYSAPPTELVNSSVSSTPIGSLEDGTQIWKITQNGVDTHPMHFHLFEVQLLNRVAWDGRIMLPEPNELGWKDTLKVNPLEDTIVALRPVVPEVPWDLPNSVRLIDPTMPEGAVLPGQIFNPNGEPISPVLNKVINFGSEYMWHCHILSHEEMEMMRPISVVVKPRDPDGLAAVYDGGVVNVSWNDNSLNETAFVVQRADNATFDVGLVESVVAENATSYQDTTVVPGATYYYRVYAANVVGDPTMYGDVAGFPTKTANSAFSATAMVTVSGAVAPAAPTGLSATLQTGPQVALEWTDNADNETGFVIERSVNGSPFAVLATPVAFTGTGTATYVDSTVMGGNTYAYRVQAVNGAGASAWSNTIQISIPAVMAPSSLAGVATRVGNSNSARVTLTWMDNSNNETGFRLERSTNATFTNPVAVTLRANTITYRTGNLPRGVTYYFRIRAYNATSVSAWSNTFSVTTP